MSKNPFIAGAVALVAVLLAPTTATAADGPVDVVVLEAPAMAAGTPTSDLTLELDNPAAADDIEAELEATFGPLVDTSTYAGTMRATVATPSIVVVSPMAPTDASAEEVAAAAAEEIASRDDDPSGGTSSYHPIFCDSYDAFYDSNGRYTIQRRCGSPSAPWSYRFSDQLQAICVPYTVDERGMKWWKNDAAMPMNAPHSNVACNYLFHGTYNPVARGDRVLYGDVFQFRHNLGDGGDATVRIAGKLKFRGSG